MLPGLRFLIVGLLLTTILPLAAFGIAGSFRGAHGTAFNAPGSFAASHAPAEYYWSRFYAPAAPQALGMPVAERPAGTESADHAGLSASLPESAQTAEFATAAAPAALPDDLAAEASESEPVQETFADEGLHVAALPQQAADLPDAVPQAAPPVPSPVEELASIAGETAMQAAPAQAAPPERPEPGARAPAPAQAVADPADADAPHDAPGAPSAMSDEPSALSAEVIAPPEDLSVTSARPQGETIVPSKPEHQTSAADEPLARIALAPATEPAASILEPRPPSVPAVTDPVASEEPAAADTARSEPAQVPAEAIHDGQAGPDAPDAATETRPPIALEAIPLPRSRPVAQQRRVRPAVRRAQAADPPPAGTENPLQPFSFNPR